MCELRTQAGGVLNICALLRAGRPTCALEFGRDMTAWVEAEEFHLAPCFPLSSHSPGRTGREAAPFGEAGGRGPRG